jgi:cleavage stimulation factor subunit 3
MKLLNSNQKLFHYSDLFREKMTQAYDFALEKIGMDVYAYTIWNDYVTFLKSV